MNETITSILIIVGLVFLVGATVGILRLRDVYGRMHAAGLAGTVGIGCIMLAAVVFYAGHEGKYALKLLLLAVFVFLVSPVATHMMAKAAYFSGVKLHPGTVLDEYQERQADEPLPPGPTAPTEEPVPPVGAEG